MSLRVVVTTSGQLLGGQAQAVIQGNLDRFVTQLTYFLLAEVKKRTPQGVSGAQGGLLGSIQAEVSGRGTPAIKGVVASAHKSANVIEKGRRPGKAMPPKGALLRWLEVKLGLDARTAANIEFVVRRKIARKGFDGAHMFERAVTENMGKIEAMAAACGLRIKVELG